MVSENHLEPVLSKQTHILLVTDTHTGGTAAWPPCRVSKMTTDVSAIGRGIWFGSILDGVETWAPAWGEYGMVGVDGMPWPALGIMPPGMPGILMDGCMPPGRGP